MSLPKRPPAPPVPCAVWLRVKFGGPISDAAWRTLAPRLQVFVAGTGIRPIVSPRLIGLHSPGGLVPFDITQILAWLSSQKEVVAIDFLDPVPTLLQKGVRHDQDQ